jgi:hypothetical protein
LIPFDKQAHAIGYGHASRDIRMSRCGVTDRESSVLEGVMRVTIKGIYWLGLAAAFALPMTQGCESGPEPGPSDRVDIDNDQGRLERNVDTTERPIEVDRAGGANALGLEVDLQYPLTLVADVAPPRRASDGALLQATAISFDGDRALVSYNMAGADAVGGVDVFVFDEGQTPTLTSRAVFQDTDVNAVSAAGGHIYLATATSDPDFPASAALEMLAIDASGQLGLNGHERVPLASFAGTSVAATSERVYVTSGNTGGVYAFNTGTLEPAGSAGLDDARWVAVGTDSVYVAQGTPGRVAVLGAMDLRPQDSFAFEGAQIPESKSTIEVVGDRAFVAAGPSGVQIIDLTSGQVIGTMPVPTGLPLPADAVVTNAVSVDSTLMFVSNGAAGVYMATTNTELDADGELALTVVGRLDLGETASANHITFKDGFLFVATGKGGLKIINVAPVVPVGPNPVGFPYLTGFDRETAQDDWALGGDWGFGLADVDRMPRSGGVFLDSNPNLVDQRNHQDHLAVLNVPMDIPVEGQAVVTFWYSMAFVHANDRVSLQASEDGGSSWTNLATFLPEQTRTDYARHEVDLTAYAGKTLMFRFHQLNADASGARRFLVDDFEVAEIRTPQLQFPYETHFDTRDGDVWNLLGIWAHVADETGLGTHLSSNPRSVPQPNFRTGHTAEMMAFAPVPATGHATLEVDYRAALGDGSDLLAVDVQTAGDRAWMRLATLDLRHQKERTTRLELSLQPYAGTLLRARVWVKHADTDDIRVVALDRLRIGLLDAPTTDFPATAVLAKGEVWHTGGLWRAVAINDGSSVFEIDTAAAEMAGSGAFAELMMARFVTLPETGAHRLYFEVTSTLQDSSDAMYAEIQDIETGAWTKISTHKSTHNAEAWRRVDFPLSQFAGQTVRVRIRVYLPSTDGARYVGVRNLAIAPLDGPLAAFPYRADFSMSDDARGWDVYGTWAAAASDGGQTRLDGSADASSERGFGSYHEARMRGFVTIPETGRPMLVAIVRVALGAAGDRVVIEAQTPEDEAWRSVYTMTWDSAPTDVARLEVPMSAFAGLTVRLRLRLVLAATGESRAIEVESLSVSDGVSVTAPYPFESHFDGGAYASGWSLLGPWQFATDHGEAFVSEGFGMLDANPMDAFQSNKTDVNRTATLAPYIMLPAEAAAWLEFDYRLAFVDSADRVHAEIQTSDSSQWVQLARLDRTHGRDDYTRMSVNLADYAGQLVHFRFRITTGASAQVRVFNVDRFAVGPRESAEVLGFPYHVASFAPDADNWVLQGAWQFDAEGNLSMNPWGVLQDGFTTNQVAEMAAPVDLSGTAAPVVNLAYDVTLVTSGDRLILELQTASSTVWERVMTLSSHANTEGLATRSLPLAAWAGQTVRLRFRATFPGEGIRTAIIHALSVTEAQ